MMSEWSGQWLRGEESHELDDKKQAGVAQTQESSCMRYDTPIEKCK